MNELQKYRQKIDKIDGKIIALLSDRFSLVLKIGKIKKKSNVAIADKKREAEKLSSITLLAKQKDIDTNFIKDLWKKIFSHSYTIEEKL